MPIFRHARWMRSAISPRFAIRILLNNELRLGFDACDWLAILDGLTRFDLERLQCAVDWTDDVLPNSKHVDVADQISTAHLRPDFDTVARSEVADCRRGDDATHGVTRRAGKARGSRRHNGMRLALSAVAGGPHLHGTSHRPPQTDTPAVLAHLQLAKLAVCQSLDQTGHDLVGQPSDRRACLGTVKQLLVVAHQ